MEMSMQKRFCCAFENYQNIKIFHNSFCTKHVQFKKIVLKSVEIQSVPQEINK